jgi:single-stranded-DNA-specific exonuclease
MLFNHNLNHLSPAARTVVADYAKRRGVPSAQLNDFLNPTLELGRYALPGADKALARLNRAAAKREAVLIFGDYDADGVTSVSLLLRFLGECTELKPQWALPNRQTDHYGLGLEKAQSLFAKYKPSLLICLDCGTNSVEAIAWLKRNGVDTIVVDHHPLEGERPEAAAIINPKAHPGPGCADLRDLCAAGLVLVLCDYLANAWHLAEKWDRSVATMLAGLGTLADAVPMTPLNRAIAKHAINLINAPALNRVTGLAALVPADGQRLTQRGLQFGVIPTINALGRLASAEPGVTLLTTANQTEAEDIAAHALELNTARKAKQAEMVVQASALARGVLANHPEAPVLVLADPRWHHGVAGPAASQIAESFGRSTILLAPNGEEGRWKGSGRSANGDHLGEWIRTVKTLGLVERGGGHSAAVGLAVTSAQIAALQTAGLTLPTPPAEDHAAESEVVGNIDQLSPEEWVRIVEMLEPFGRGNPFPHIAVRNAICKSGPTALTLKNSGKAWGAKAQFKTKAEQMIAPVWRDVETALREWAPGSSYDLELEVTAKHYNGRVFFNWAVDASRRSSTNESHRAASKLVPLPLAADASYRRLESSQTKGADNLPAGFHPVVPGVGETKQGGQDARYRQHKAAVAGGH